MFKIIYLIITLAIIHFTLYYFNFDFTFDYFNMFNKPLHNDTLHIDNIIPEINASINELKTLNECINNGQINTSLS